MNNKQKGKNKDDVFKDNKKGKDYDKGLHQSIAIGYL